MSVTLSNSLEAQDLDAHTKEFAPIYEAGVLQPEVHARLVLDLKRIASVAHIPEYFIYRPIKEWCGNAEVTWIREFRKHASEGVAGAAFCGKAHNVDDRMMAMVGALVRNFIDARYMTLQQVFEALEKGTVPDCRVIAIPNFMIESDKGAHPLPSYKSSSLLGFLYHRHSLGLATIVYFSDLSTMGTLYGNQIANHIKDKFKIFND